MILGERLGRSVSGGLAGRVARHGFWHIHGYLRDRDLVPALEMANMDDGELDLATWGEIAKVLRVSIDTAKNWSRDLGLPVCKTPSGRIMASSTELAAWLRGQSPKSP
jgi:hypothetical protein